MAGRLMQRRKIAPGIRSAVLHADAVCAFCRWPRERGPEDTPRYRAASRALVRAHHRQDGSGENYLVVDHILPIAQGGTNDVDNLRPLCDRCNTIKSHHRDGELGGAVAVMARREELARKIVRLGSWWQRFFRAQDRRARAEV